jgi:hypothetical protein
MRRLFLFILSFLPLSPLSCATTYSPILKNAEDGFQKRWHDFGGETRKFPLWTPSWDEEELKVRFAEMTKERWMTYFENPGDLKKPNGVLRHTPNFKEPANFTLFGSRYPYPVAFAYNLADPRYNASIITLEGKQYLALEAPTQETLPRFLSILDHYRVTDLVRLTPALFKTRECSFPYWEGHILVSRKTGRPTIKVASRDINYFYTDDWVDDEGIAPEELLALIRAVMKSRDGSSQMIAVHCRAGLGRTGTFLVAYALVQEIDGQIAKGIDPAHMQLSIDKIVWEISLQRAFMVPHFPQYKALYQFVDYYIESSSFGKSIKKRQ